MWIALVALLFAVGPARASGEAEEAEATFVLGARAYGERDYTSALAYFLASNRLAPNPSVAFNIARCYARLEKYAEAYRWFVVARDGLKDSKSVQDAVKRELQDITPQVVIYDVKSEPPGARVYVERKDLGIIGTTPFTIAMVPLDGDDPPRRFIFERDGFQDVTVEDVPGVRGSHEVVETQLVQIVGTVSLQAPAGTVVHQGAPDGPVVCEAPCDAKLPPGNWVLYFVKDGYRDAMRQLVVEANQQTTSLVELTPNTGSVVVDASERGALVEVDGVAVGFTPTVVQGVPVGERLVRVSRVGYLPVERPVVVETDKQVVIDDVELLPLNEVTAVSRRTERAELAPSSVTTIGKEELNAFLYPTIYEALRGVRGISILYDSVYGSTNVRGIGQANDYNNRMLITQDGAVLNDNFYLGSLLTYEGRTDLGGVERIEIVRGPGSVLYGTGAFSSVVNVVTDSPEAPEGTEFGVSTYQNGVVRGRAQAHYMLSEGVGFRAAISGAGSQGRVEILNPRGVGDDAIETPGFDQFVSGTTHGRIWLGDATLQWYHSGRRIYVPTGLFYADFNDPSHVWIDTRSMGELRYEPQLSEGVDLLSRVYVNRYTYDGELPYGVWHSVESVLGLGVGGEARLVIEPSDRFRLTGGGVVDHSPVARVYGEDVNQRTGAKAEYVDGDLPYTIYAAYGLLDLVPVDAVRLHAGLRADYWTTFGLALSPRAALVLIPDEGDIVKIMGGRAFRAPSIYEFAYDAPFQIAPEELNPETVWSGEVEYTHAFDEAWTGLIAGHGGLVENLVISRPAGPGAATFVNSDQPVRIAGLDLELRRGFQGGWMLSSFYTLLDTRTAEGELVPNAPQHNAGLKLIVPISAPVARVAFRTSLEAPRRIDPFRDATTGWAVISDLVLSGTVPERSFEYGVGVYNLFDMDYALPVTDSYPFRTVPQQGRSLMASLSIGF